MRIKLIIAATVIKLCSFTIDDVQAREFPKPIFPVEKVELKSFVVEHIYPYKVLYYKQPLKIDIVPNNLYRYDTPENTLTAIISSMKHLNIDDTSGWDLESSNEEKESLKNQEYRQNLLAAWEKTFSNADFYLLRRVNRNDFVVLDYTAKSPDGTEFRNTLNFSLENGIWKATNTFSSDYVSNYLNSGSTRIIGGSDY